MKKVYSVVLFLKTVDGTTVTVMGRSYDNPEGANLNASQRNSELSHLLRCVAKDASGVNEFPVKSILNAFGIAGHNFAIRQDDVHEADVLIRA